MTQVNMGGLWQNRFYGDEAMRSSELYSIEENVAWRSCRGAVYCICYIKKNKRGDMMEALADFSKQLLMLEQAREQDMDNPFILHGIIRLFARQFDLAIKVFQQLLKRDGQGMAAMGSPKEIIAAAYEEYVFVDEAAWMAMLKVRNDDAAGNEDAPLLVQTILDEYMPVFRTLEAEAPRA